MEADRVWVKRRIIMVKSGAEIMSWGGWECMVTEELEIQKAKEKVLEKQNFGEEG
jgi:hypothetical protein